MRVVGYFTDRDSAAGHRGVSNHWLKQLPRPDDEQTGFASASSSDICVQVFCAGTTTAMQSANAPTVTSQTGNSAMQVALSGGAVIRAPGHGWVLP